MPILIPIGAAVWKIGATIAGGLVAGGAAGYGAKRYLGYKAEKNLQAAYAQGGKQGLKAAMVSEKLAMTDGQAEYMADQWIRQHVQQAQQPQPQQPQRPTRVE